MLNVNKNDKCINNLIWIVGKKYPIIKIFQILHSCPAYYPNCCSPRNHYHTMAPINLKTDKTETSVCRYVILYLVHYITALLLSFVYEVFKHVLQNVMLSNYFWLIGRSTMPNKGLLVKACKTVKFDGGYGYPDFIFLKYVLANILNSSQEYPSPLHKAHPAKNAINDKKEWVLMIYSIIYNLFMFTDEPRDISHRVQCSLLQNMSCMIDYI